MNSGKYLEPAFLVSLILISWSAFSVRTIFLGGEINVGLVVTNLLAGIVFVDWLAVEPQIPALPSAIIFLALFGLTKLLQNFVPAT